MPFDAVFLREGGVLLSGDAQPSPNRDTPERELAYNGTTPLPSEPHYASGIDEPVL